MHHQPFFTRFSSGLLLLVAPLLLVACTGNEIDIDALNAEALKRQKQVRTADSLAITKYIADSSFTKVERRPSGLFIVRKAAGTGDTARVGKRASVIYKGTLLNNQLFDQSVLGPDGKRQPITFTVGAGQVIMGWELGIRVMRKGEKAILLIPSELAYGSRGAGNVIGPDAPLRFDVELTDVQ